MKQAGQLRASWPCSLHRLKFYLKLNILVTENNKKKIMKLVMIMRYLNLVKMQDNISQYNFWLTQMRSYA